MQPGSFYKYQHFNLMQKEKKSLQNEGKIGENTKRGKRRKKDNRLDYQDSFRNPYRRWRSFARRFGGRSVCDLWYISGGYGSHLTSFYRSEK
jgi:hypothetical protein